MRLDDRAMTILTGLVLAIVVGTIAQQSPRILEMFSNQPTAELVDDFFLVRAGVPQELDLLGNDTIQNIDGDLVIAGRPRCGRVSFSGSKAMFLAKSDCDGNVVFSYCVAGVADCKPAAVSLNVRANRDDVRVIAAAPVAPARADPVPTPPQPSIQNAVQTSSAEPPLPASATSTDDPVVSVLVANVDAPLPQVQPAPDPTYLNPAKIAQVARIAGANHNRRGAQFRPRQLDLDVAALSHPNHSPAGVARFLGRATGDRIPGVALNRNAVRAPPSNGLVPLASSSGQTEARYGDCQVSMGLQLADFAEVWVALTSNCNGDDVIEVAHGETSFLIPLDGAGTAKMRLPALHTSAKFIARFPGHEAPIVGEVSVPDLLGMTRSLVSLDAKTELDLSAREYDQLTGRDRVIAIDQGTPTPDVARGAVGYLRAYSGPNGKRHFVYSRRGGLDRITQLTKLQLVGERNRACDMTARVSTLMAEPAHQPGETVEYTLPSCDGQGRYESHLRDIRVMPRDA